MLIRSRAPLRLGLAGGGTDVESFSNIFGGRVLNVTISMYAHSTIKLTKKYISFVAKDLLKKEKYLVKKIYKISTNSGLFLHRETYKYMMKKYNNGKLIPLEILTWADVPPGSGLGSSSTLIVSMIAAYLELLNLPIDNYQIANDAYYIERKICKKEGGKQDQFAASFGGINIFEFIKKKTFIYPVKVKDKIINEFEESLTLYYNGVSRNSSEIISEQNKEIKKKKLKTIKAMKNIKKESYEFVNSLIKGNFQELFNCFNRGWLNKIKTSKSITNKAINDIISYAKKNGAIAAKVSGAGGGGFIIFFSKPENKYSLQSKLNLKANQIFNCRLTFRGVEAWKI